MLKKSAWTGLGSALLLVTLGLSQQPPGKWFEDRPGPPLPERESPLKTANQLLRFGKTDEARQELNRLLKDRPEDPEIHYQIARSYLLDFYQGGGDPTKQRVALNLAMEALLSTLKRDPDHIPSLKAKAVIHARPELLYYDPNLAYDLAARVGKLQPDANEYLLNLTDWMTGEVRFTHESGHRVPQDPQIGLDRALDLLERVLDRAMPYSNEEAAAYFQMATTLSRRGNYRESLGYYQQALPRAKSVDQKVEVLREMGASYYRMGNFVDAARQFVAALQIRNRPLEQWLLKVSMDALGPAAPPIPSVFRFQAGEARVDPANAPLLEFEDIAPELGINRFSGNGTVAWGDIDGDGKYDVIVAGSGTFIVVYRNEGARFPDITQEAGLSKVPAGYSVNLVDYDNDGDLDLYISYDGWSGPRPNKLFQNDGKGHFKDVSKQSGADDPGDGFVSLWGDLDNDGWLDLVIANGVLKDGSVPQIYRNNGNGTFTNVTRQAGLDEPATHGAIGAALGDYDKDGRLDIFFNGLDNSPNRLYHNEGNLRFKEVTKEAGVNQPLHNGFVCFFFDYNNDGWPDLLTVSLAPWDAVVEGLKKGFAPPNARAIHPDSSRLFKNNGNGTFTDVTYESRLWYPMGTMGAGVADLDNDGFMDVYIGTGDPQLSRLEPNRFFRNNGNGTFSDLTTYVNLARPGNKGHGVAFVDIDEDGDLDVYAQLGGHYLGDHAYSAFYRNKKGNLNNWFEIDLHGTKSNRDGIGAQVTVKASGMTLYREVKGSEGFGATSPYRQHFGLGKAEKIDSLEIRWPSGVRQTFSDVAVNQIVAASENSEAVRKLK